MTQNKTEISTLKKGTCPSLSNRSELTYEFGFNNKAKSLLFRIAGNSGSGHFQATSVPLDNIIKLLNEAKNPFSLSVFKPIYPGGSINSVGFLGAILLKEGLIERSKRHYVRKDTKPLLTELNKLIKPTKTSTKKNQKK